MDEINKRKIGFKIKITREEMGLSREELALRLKSSKNYIYKLESGRGGYTLETMHKIANALECSISKLYEWSDNIEKMGVKDQEFQYGKKIDTLELLIERLFEMLKIDPEQLAETLPKKPKAKLELIIELLEKLPSDQQKKIVTRLIEKSYSN